MNEYKESVLDVVTRLRGKVCDAILSLMEVLIKARDVEDASYWITLKTYLEYVEEKSKKEIGDDEENKNCKDCKMAKESGFLSNICNIEDVIKKAENCILN